MRYVSFVHGDRSSYGVLRGERIADLGACAGAPADLRAALASGRLPQLAADAVDARSLAVSEVALLPVIPNPAKILCVGINYEDHRAEAARAAVPYPSIFARFTDTLVGAGDDIVLPKASSMFDYEGELAVIIGRPGRAIAEGQALDHIAGYSCFNDGSIRDWQRHTAHITAGKNFPHTGALGPALVTPDEIPDLAAVTVTTRLNGQQVQHASVAQMVFSVAQIIAYISAFTPLSAGDVIATGTPSGVGAARKPPLWMKVGAVVEVEISGVGVLRNRVAAE
jgi:2-keto-4-pentenoate hydratase/2-oxohepta-3-ene-1,7-dioic acid hydratase in catechol pathway